MSEQHTPALAALRRRVAEAALKISPDYPGIKTCEPWEQLYAIECAYEGTNLANGDLHAIIADLLAASEEAAVCLEHSCPPAGGYTARVIDEVRAAIAKAKPNGS